MPSTTRNTAHDDHWVEDEIEQYRLIRRLVEAHLGKLFGEPKEKYKLAVKAPFGLELCGVKA